MHLTHTDILQQERRYRGHLINSLGGFKSALLIGTKSDQGHENLAIFSSFFHIGADPALCGIVVRPTTPGLNTLHHILSTSHYTLNHIAPSFYQQAHQCSAKYEDGISEFNEVGLTPLYLPGIHAPFVAESRIRFACELVQKIDIELNGTTILIGQIIHIEVPDEVLGNDGFIDIEKASSVTCSGLDSYHVTKKIGRLSYAKTDQPPMESK
jgi:flavin reductase (DIM6/NTAB) family NADH-FMN oxidoreductase RutF